jgi:anti-anti-sigma factor
MDENTGTTQVVFESDHSVTVARFTCKEISSLEAIDRLLQAFTQKIESPGTEVLLIDFSGVRFVATSAINLLLVVLKRMRVKGGDVCLCSVAPNVEKIFKLMQLSRLFEIFPSRDPAIQALAARKPGASGKKG